MPAALNPTIERPVVLGEQVEDLRQQARRDADAGVNDPDDDLHPLAPLLLVGLRCGQARLEDFDDGPVTWMVREPRVVEAHVEGRTFGILGEPRVNVLLVNLALDRQFGRPVPLAVGISDSAESNK